MIILTFHQRSSHNFTPRFSLPFIFRRFIITLKTPVLHFTSLHFTSLHFTSLHITTLHLTVLYLHLLSFALLCFTSLHFTSLHFTSLHFTLLYFTSLHLLHSPFPPCLSLHPLNLTIFLSGRPSVCWHTVYQLASNKTDFRGIWCWGHPLKSAQKLRILL